VGGLADSLRRDAGLALRVLERVRLDGGGVRLELRGGAADERVVREPAAMISRPMAFASAMSLPTSRPSHRSAHSAESVRRGSIAYQPGTPTHPLQDVVEEDRVRLPGVAAPQEDEIRLLGFTI
jgi:hypothetical protein